MRFVYFLFAFSIYFLLPSDVHAWGPGAHLEYALHALAHLSALAPAVQAVLRHYPNDFLYGNLAADIILGKKYAGDLYHCHHWEVALPLLEQAKTDRQRAFIYGYLNHLSVDTVSHNYFVPYHIIKSYEAYTLRHTYWEMRFDLKMPEQVWEVLQELAHGDYHENDVLLSGSLKKALFSFGMNKRIFDSLLLVQRMKRWQNAAASLASRSSYLLPDEDVREFKEVCHEVSLDFLTHLEKGRALRADPTGDSKLLYAKQMSQKLKKYTSKNILSSDEAESLIQQIRSSLREGIYQPTQLPEIYDVL